MPRGLAADPAPAKLLVRAILAASLLTLAGCAVGPQAEQVEQNLGRWYQSQFPEVRVREIDAGGGRRITPEDAFVPVTVVFETPEDSKEKSFEVWYRELPEKAGWEPFLDFATLSRSEALPAGRQLMVPYGRTR